MWKWKLICWLIAKLSRPERLEHRLLSLRGELQHHLDQFGDSWTTFNLRPKTPLKPIAHTTAAARVGVVIQGKVMRANDFTLRTVEHYSRTFPDCPLFVSTWNDEADSVVQELESAGATVLLSDPPEFPAPSHINYQIRSTYLGLQAVHAAGCRYALKTRTDTRMYASQVGDLLAGLVEQFPVKPGCGAKGRLAVLDFATRMYYPHHPSDLMMFGYTEDLLTYWSAPLCESPKTADRPACPQISDLLRSVVPEIYLCRHYYEKLGYVSEPTVASWWQSLADLFIVVDRMMLEHFWPKYNYAMEHCSSVDQHLRNESICTFRDWLGIMTYAKRPNFGIGQLARQRPNGLLQKSA